MNTNNKNHVHEESLDSFSRALLDKKNDMALYKNQPTSKEEPIDRTSQEQSFSSALDQLRKERGQMPIEEEERRFQAKMPVQDPFAEEEDFTTSSLDHSSIDEMNMIQQALLTEEKDDSKETKETIKKVKEHVEKEKKKKEPTEKQLNRQNNKKRRWIIILIICLLFAASLAGYVYKILVWNPQNVITETQQKTFDKFRQYAEEWNMLSDSEKFELIDLDKKYDTLLEKQKTELDTIFKENTGKAYSQTLADVKALQEELTNENDPNYQAISSFMNDWATKGDTDKIQVVSLRSNYESLSTPLQEKIDDLSREKAGKSFTALLSEWEETYNEQERARQEQEQKEREEKLSQLQQELSVAQKELQTYQQYGQTLQEDLAFAQSQGMDTTDIQQQITTNDQQIAQYQQTVNSLNSQIQALQ